MRYDYLCESCGVLQEVTCSMSDRKDAVPCACGGTASQYFGNVPYAFMRFRPYEFNPAKVVGNNGAAFGRTADQQHARYKHYFESVKKQCKQRNRSLSKNRFDEQGVRWMGGMPGEMVDSIGQQEGDPEVVSKDPEHFLKATGLHYEEGKS